MHKYILFSSQGTGGVSIFALGGKKKKDKMFALVFLRSFEAVSR